MRTISKARTGRDLEEIYEKHGIGVVCVFGKARVKYVVAEAKEVEMATGCVQRKEEYIHLLCAFGLTAA